MSKLSGFIGGGGGLKPFQDLGTVTGTVNLDLSQYGSFRVVQGAGDLTLNVINADPDGAGVFELFFYRNRDWSVAFNGFEFVGNGYQDVVQNMTALDYDGVSFSFAGQDTAVQATAFSNDGAKMFMVGRSSNTVHQYTLSTEFDLTTASYDNVSVAVQGNVYDITLSANGTKMFATSTADSSIHQYTLTTGFDLTTASYDGVSYSVAGQEQYPRSTAFNADGTKMFILGYNSNPNVYQYTLTTGFDLTTASYDGVSFSFAGQDASSFSLAFNADGTKMFILGSSSSIHQYTLTTGFDLTTASYDGVSYSVAGQGDITFSNNGAKVFIVVSADSVYQYTPTYDLGPLFTYPLTQIGNKVTLDTQSTDFSIKDAV